MSWIRFGDRGYLVQCDNCDYIMGSSRNADRGRPRIRHKRLFGTQVAPATWLVEHDSFGDSHLCPHCQEHSNAVEEFE
jgi:hypothetical protein